MWPKVSIIVPIYKSENFLRKCVESILAQTIREIEVILVDDGSPDSSGIIANEYALKDNRVKVIHQNNRGPSAARNAGMESAKGKYIGFVDADDWIESEMYKNLYSSAILVKAQIAMCNFLEEDAVKSNTNIVSHPYNNDEFLNKDRIVKEIVPTFAKNKDFGYYSMCNKIYSRKFLEDIKLSLDESRDHGEDWGFNIEIFTVLESIVFIDKPYYHYVHINKESLMVKYRANQFDLILSGRKLLIDRLSGCGIKISKFKAEIDKRFIYESIGCILGELSNNKNWVEQNKKVKVILLNGEVKTSLKSFKGGSLKTKLLVFLMKTKRVNLIRCYNYVSKTIKSSV